MEFFLLNYINISSLLYLIYSIIIIYLITFIHKIINKKKISELTLSDDQCFVLNNKYDIKSIFYFITYKLYKNKVILLSSSKYSFYLNKNATSNLSKIELEVSKLYKSPFSPNDFNSGMINESIFQNYFNSIYTSLESDNFIKSKKYQLISKIIFTIGLFFVLIPGLVILISFYLKGILLSKIFITMLINTLIYILILKNSILSILTPNGINASISYKEKNTLAKRLSRRYSYDTSMKKFLLQNYYMYYYDEDVDDENDSDDGDE